MYVDVSDFQDDFLSDLGFEPGDPCIRAAVEDAETHSRIIETLVKVRKDRDLSQKVVAKRMGTTQSRVSNFERIGGDPRLSTLLRYARAVDTKLRITASAAPRGWEAEATFGGTATSSERPAAHFNWKHTA